MSLDVFDYLDQIGQQRYRALIFHTSHEKSAMLSLFSKKICEKTSGRYLDLLACFINNPNYSDELSSFKPEKLREFLIEHSRGTHLLNIDRADFLLDTWRKKDKDAFFRFLNNQWDGFKDAMKAKLIINLQTSSEIEALSILDSQGNSRIRELSDFSDIM
ncbi:MAG: hypothetical protein WCY93_09355 [Anaerolineaceae bacterium]